ncbi:hypothetical protein [Streptomyces sp. NPDC047000]|uniref:hypothetical protein n=1 Tax=Streptomyces sp. NPDC047000 TaxID=3155474 RepID=UPI0033E7907F
MTRTIAFGHMAPALAFAARLAESHPALPAPSVTCTGIFAERLSLALDAPGEVEAWREVLHVPVEEVDVTPLADGLARIGFDVLVGGFEIDVYAHFELAGGAA